LTVPFPHWTPATHSVELNGAPLKGIAETVIASMPMYGVQYEQATQVASNMLLLTAVFRPEALSS
jgi:hypothetical protein